MYGTSIIIPIETHQSCLYFLHDWRTSSKRITCSASIRMADTHRLNPKTDRSKNRQREKNKEKKHECLPGWLRFRDNISLKLARMLPSCQGL